MGNTPTYKGSGIVFIRNLIATSGEKCIEKFNASLSEQDLFTLSVCMPSSKVPDDFASKLIMASGRALYEDADHGIRDIGEMMASDHLSLLYKILMRVVTVNAIIGQSAIMCPPIIRGQGPTRQSVRPGSEVLEI